jgi:hypothetical protein
MTDVEWRAVVGYEGLYEVSACGQIRSLPRLAPHYTGVMLTRGGRLLKGCYDAKGYRRVSLCREGRTRGFHVHTLVAAAFLGPRPPGMVTRHKDGNTKNNSVTNLAYGTSQDNSDDMRLHGTVRRGSNHARAKVTDEQVLEIRALHRILTYRELAGRFGLSVNQIDNIVNRHQWRHI